MYPSGDPDWVSVLNLCRRLNIQWATNYKGARSLINVSACEATRGHNGEWRKSSFVEPTHSGNLDNFSVFDSCIWEINSRGETANSFELAKLSKLSSAEGGREGGGQRWHIQKCIESNISFLYWASHQATTERKQKCRVNSVLITCYYMGTIKYQVWNRYGGGANIRTSKLSPSHCPHPCFFLLLLFSIAVRE